MVNNLVENQGGLHNRITRQIHLSPFTLYECKLYLQSREFDELYTALFNCADKYVAVVEALAQKRKGLQKKEIAEITGVSGGRLTHILANLERSDFIMSMAQFGKNVKNTAYKLVDFYTLFYYKFVKNNNSKDENFWLHHFNDGENGTQIDLLIDRVDRMIHLCEIKFTNGQYAISKDYAEKLKARASVFKVTSKTRKSLVHTFVTVDGVLKNNHSSLLHSEVTAKDLFEP